MFKLIKFLIVILIGFFLALIFMDYQETPKEKKDIQASFFQVIEDIKENYKDTKNDIAQDIEEAGETISEAIEKL